MKHSISSSSMVYQLLLSNKNQMQQNEEKPSNNDLYWRKRWQQQSWMIILLVVVTFFLIQSHIMIMSIRSSSIMLTSKINGNTTNDRSSSVNITTIPSIAFLFLADRQMNEDMWESWFHDAADRSMYSIYVHYGKGAVKQEFQANSTDNSSSMIENTTTWTIPYLGRFFCQYTIPSVPTSWYWLYDAQMQLLQYAYDADPNAAQFVYVSDTSIPLISFNEMYENLIYGKDNNHKNDDDIKMTQKSRFCMGTDENSHKAWKSPASLLNVSLNDVRKGEMWSIIIRTHVQILLDERPTLNIWNQTFYSSWLDYGYENVGAPDENLFPTMLNLKSLSSSEQYMEQNCSHERRGPYCCSTIVFWQKPGSGPVGVFDFDTNQYVILSDACAGSRMPCTFNILLDEHGLIAIQKAGFFFLRKVMATRYDDNQNVISVVVRTKLNETILLNDALKQLHQHQPMNSVITERRISSSDVVLDNNNQHEYQFQCTVPHQA